MPALRVYIYVIDFIVCYSQALEHHDDDPLKKLSTKSMVTCRICKGDHWTTKCPYKDTLGSVPEMEEGECWGWRSTEQHLHSVLCVHVVLSCSF